MIPRRYVWLLRDEGTCFEHVSILGGNCKVCAALERGSGHPWSCWYPRTYQARHLAAHRAEKITADDPEAAVVAAATERN